MLGLPRKPVFDFMDDRKQRLLQIPFKEIPDEDRMDHDFAVLALLRRGPGHEGRSFHEIHQPVIAARNDTFGEDDQRIPRIGHGFDGALQGFPVHAFAVNTGSANPRQQKPLNPADQENMPARDDMKRPAHRGGQ